MIPGLKGGFQTISVAEQLVSLSQRAAGPAFELQFNNIQNAVLGRMDAEIEALRKGGDDGSGATALLEVRQAGIRRDLDAITAYHARTRSNRVTADGILTRLNDLSALAIAGGGGAFDAAKAVVRAEITRLDTPLMERFAVSDGLRKVRAEALATLDAIVHNDFAGQADIDTTQAALADLVTKFDAARAVTAINEQDAYNLSTNSKARLADLDSQIETIKADARTEQLTRITEKRDRFSAILSALSLSFEIAREMSAKLAANTVLRREIEPGSVLNLFS